MLSRQMDVFYRYFRNNWLWEIRKGQIWAKISEISLKSEDCDFLDLLGSCNPFNLYISLLSTVVKWMYFTHVIQNNWLWRIRKGQNWSNSVKHEGNKLKIGNFDFIDLGGSWNPWHLFWLVPIPCNQVKWMYFIHHVLKTFGSERSEMIEFDKIWSKISK